MIWYSSEVGEEIRCPGYGTCPRNQLDYGSNCILATLQSEEEGREGEERGGEGRGGVCIAFNHKNTIMIILH